MSYNQADVDKLKAEQDRKVLKLKKAAEIQMRNVKLMAKDKARKLLEETVGRLKRQFQKEMLHMLVEFDHMRE